MVKLYGKLELGCPCWENVETVQTQYEPGHCKWVYARSIGVGFPSFPPKATGKILLDEKKNS